MAPTELFEPTSQSIAHKRLKSSNLASAGKVGIYQLDVDLYESRVALLSRHGPPLRGYLDTDLPAGVHTLTVDQRQRRWNIAGPGVKPGLRFVVDIEGPDPFDLEYESPLRLVVHPGANLPDGGDSVTANAARIEQAWSENNQPSIWQQLLELSDIALYDTLDELWTRHWAGQVILHALLHSALTVLQDQDDIELYNRVLRAAESFAHAFADTYVDAYSSYLIAPESVVPDPARLPPLSTLQLCFTYDKEDPVRSIVVYADDILGPTPPDPVPPAYGQMGLRYPRWLSHTTTPRMHKAKQEALEHLAWQNLISIIEQTKDAYETISTAWMIYGFAGPLANAAAGKWFGPKGRPQVDSTVGAAMLRRPPWKWRGIQPAKGGPGSWEPEFGAGRGMNAEDAWAQLDLAGTPPGWQYSVDGVQFENLVDGKLIDVKNWKPWGAVLRSLRGVSGPEMMESKIVQAVQQTIVGQRRGHVVQWIVTDRESARLVEEALRFRAISPRHLEVVYRAARPMPAGWVPRIPIRL
ncbi:hypothetical protein ACFYVR_03230 [Rhodococcus sp. NPDC003318]|uniref:hypothetical protein n=1 Tax=Rhodococcus sp. NPDC003318 TaxID=3364503 RepID=UPI0036B654F4